MKISRSKLLVFLIGSLGDSVVAIPALRAIRRRYPDWEIVLFQNRPFTDLVQASEVVPDDLVDRSIDYFSGSFNRSGPIGFLRVWRRLRRERFEAAAYLVISERRNSAVIRDRIFFRSCGISKLLGFHSFSSEELFPTDPALPTESEAVRKLKRLERDGLVWDENDLQTPLMSFSDVEAGRICEWLRANRKKPNAPLIAIAPGTKKPACAWPTENFIELGSRLIRETAGELVVVGGKSEKELGDELTSAWGEGINAAGSSSVRDAANLLSKCDLYVGVDTGTTHLAAAAGTPWFAIFHQRDNPGQWHPLGDGVILTADPVACAGCRLVECPFPEHPCMKGISADKAWNALKPFTNKVLAAKYQRALLSK